MNGFKVFCFMVLLGWQFTASAERIKDVSMVEGVRSNQLVGYGLVVGLPGTGEQSRLTEQSFKGMLNSFLNALPSSLKPKN
jgi:Flagellar basal-body P-ring protein